MTEASGLLASLERQWYAVVAALPDIALAFALLFAGWLVAVGILVFGSLLARILGGLVYTYLSNVGSSAAEPISALARFALLGFVLFTAAEQLAIESRILVSAFQIAFSAICLALALAFGIGGRDWAASVIDRYSRKQSRRCS